MLRYSQRMCTKPEKLAFSELSEVELALDRQAGGAGGLSYSHFEALVFGNAGLWPVP